MDGAFEHQVRQRAYEIWMANGQTEGQAHDHWVAAERDLMAAPAAKIKKARAPAKPKKPVVTAVAVVAKKPRAKAKSDGMAANSI